MGRISKKIYGRPKRTKISLIISFAGGLFSTVFGSWIGLMGLLMLVAQNMEGDQALAFGLAWRMPGGIMIIIGLFYWIFMFTASSGKTTLQLKSRGKIGVSIGIIGFISSLLTFTIYIIPQIGNWQNIDFLLFPIIFHIMLLVLTVGIPLTVQLLVSKDASHGL